jgi:hypothetical protein
VNDKEIGIRVRDSGTAEAAVNVEPIRAITNGNLCFGQPPFRWQNLPGRMDEAKVLKSASN